MLMLSDRNDYAGGDDDIVIFSSYWTFRPFDL